MLHSVDAAEDVVQISFIKVWETATTWQPKANFSTWFYKILYHACIDSIRKQSRFMTSSEALLAQQAAQDNIEQTYEYEVALHQIQIKIQSLPNKQRAALILCYYEGIPQQEAADILEINLKALEGLLFRARTNLKTWWQKQSTEV